MFYLCVVIVAFIP